MKKGTIVFIAAIAGIGFYFTSAPFRAKFDKGVEEATKWTPRNIHKNPEGYVTWAIGEADRAIEDIEVRAIALSQQFSKSNELLLKKASEEKITTKLLDSYKKEYKKAATRTAWPTEVGKKLYSEQQLKNKIVMLGRNLNSVTTQRVQVDNFQKEATRHLDDLSLKKDEIIANRSDLSQKLETIRMSETIANIDQFHAEISGMLATVDAVSNQSTMPTTDELIRQEIKEAAIEDEFSSIMGE
ncbi:MAG: hypothetical protein V5783_06955 [Pontiella sp.]